MTALSDQQISELDAALASLEACVETPVVPGELAEWCGRALAALEMCYETYLEQARPAHERQLAEIREQDQEMSTLADQLAGENEAIVVELQRLRSLVHVYAAHVDPKAEGSDEDTPEVDRQSLVQEILAVVIRMRTLERSLQTWFVEAFQRDRGVAD